MTQEEFIKRTAGNVSRTLIREGYGDLDKKWSDIGKGIVKTARNRANGIGPSKNNGGKTIGGYVRDNFGQDKGFGLRKLGRQFKRGAQVAVAAPAVTAAHLGGTAVHGAKEMYGKAKGLLKQFIGESNLKFEVPDYTHFAVRKSDNHIVNGWDYSDIPSSELRQFMRDYFIVDLEDMGLDPKKFKIWTVRGCKNNGIDPFDPTSWDNTTEEDCI